MKIKERVLKIMGKGLVVGFMVQSCVLGSVSIAGAVKNEAPVMAGMEALVGELSWVSETVEVALLDRSEEYVVLSVSPLVEYINPVMRTGGQKEDLSAWVE